MFFFIYVALINEFFMWQNACPFINVSCPTQMYVVAFHVCRCRSTDTNSDPLTHRAAVDKRAADKFDHWCHLSSLSDSLSLSRDTYLEALRHPHRRHDLVYWNVHFTSTENAGQYQSQRTDKPSNKDSIFNVWPHAEWQITKADSYTPYR